MDRKELRDFLLKTCRAFGINAAEDVDDSVTLKNMGMNNDDVAEILIFIENVHGVWPEGITIESTFGDLNDAVHVLLL
jgi:hypothetical protein